MHADLTAALQPRTHIFATDETAVIPALTQSDPYYVLPSIREVADGFPLI